MMGDQEYLIMSDSALQKFNGRSDKKIEKYNPIISSSLDTIESLWGRK